ncbi:MAG: Mfa1 family fimbria major subunit [Dysgonomonas sp.]|nr:Mfa1 family fimbria major subunit [Dysgonomonas sp.]
MNLKKLFFAIIIGLSFAACSSDDDADQSTVKEGLPTYVQLSVSMPKANSQKALPEDFNPDGDYEGEDGIYTLDVYMVSADGTLEAKRFQEGDLSTTGSVLSPSQPFRTTSGKKTVYVVVNSPNPLLTTVPKDDDLLAITGLAKIESDATSTYDVITMTGKTESATIEPDVTAQDVTNGANRVAVQLTRTASRVIVTTTASTDIMHGTVKVGTLSNITYSIAQGTTKVYFSPKADYTTWGSSYVPTTADYATTATNYYDYSDLLTPSVVPAKPTAADGYKSLPGKFLFENTHTPGDVKTSQYKKGNTAYILVRAKFTPEASYIADGGALTNGTFYVGQTDGKLYSTKAAAQAAVAQQKVQVYQNGKMMYYAWLNPDNITSPLNSPVLRNNIYHVNITAFARIGGNWNPLYPEDPNNPNPQNPDPKPVNPDEPENPIDPTDPLTPEQTYMTVDITVLNWTVHSYDIEL